MKGRLLNGTRRYRKKKQKVYIYFYQQIQINAETKSLKRRSFNGWQQFAEAVTIINSFNKKTPTLTPSGEQFWILSSNNTQNVFYGFPFGSKVFHFLGGDMEVGARKLMANSVNNGKNVLRLFTIWHSFWLLLWNHQWNGSKLSSLVRISPRVVEQFKASIILSILLNSISWNQQVA